MNSVTISLIAFACIFGAALLGMFLQGHLPEHHLNEDSKRVVNLGAGIIGTMAALVLGLLVASAKGNYDTQSNELTAVAAKIILLDRGLAYYGGETKDARDLLRRAVIGMVVQLWPSERHSQANFEPAQPNAPVELYTKIQGLSPQNETQRSIKAQALAIVADIAEKRWLMFEQQRSYVSKPLLVILVFALAINFLSFGLFAPRNATVMATLCLCALAMAGAIFLILELYRPFGGFIQIPSITLRNALAQLGP
jgi:hypothetical protein